MAARFLHCVLETFCWILSRKSVLVNTDRNIFLHKIENTLISRDSIQHALLWQALYSLSFFEKKTKQDLGHKWCAWGRAQAKPPTPCTYRKSESVKLKKRNKKIESKKKLDETLPGTKVRI